MKFSIALLAISFAAIATAQDACIQTALAIPACGQTCLLSAGSELGCASTDFACQCTQSAAVQSKAQNCVISGCGNIQTALAVQSSANALCSCVSAHPVSSAPATTSAEATSTSSATPGSSASSSSAPETSASSSSAQETSASASSSAGETSAAATTTAAAGTTSTAGNTPSPTSSAVPFTGGAQGVFSSFMGVEALVFAVFGALIAVL